MKLIPLPALADNYIWMLHDEHRAWVVDPGDAEPVLRALAANKLGLQGILVTHHHPDHTGGVAQLRDATGATVLGTHHATMPEPLRRVGDGASVDVLGLPFRVIAVPGHTLDHVAYYCPDMGGAPLLFCGDTLFSGGCGRLFEGTPTQMHASLDTLAALPGDTRVCCTHEYTLSNLAFARVVEPDNAALLAYQRQCQTLRAANLPTLHSTIERERAINPFLRCSVATVAAAAQRFSAELTASQGVFATLRTWKNQF